MSDSDLSVSTRKIQQYWEGYFDYTFPAVAGGTARREEGLSAGFRLGF